MFCSQCGTEVPDDSAFCHGCGASMTPTTVAPEAEAATPAVEQTEAAPPPPAARPPAEQPVAGQPPAAAQPQAAGQPGATPTFAPQQVAQPGQVVMVPVEQEGPHIILRALWYFFIGWWVGQLAVLFGWIMNITIIGLPAGLYVLNRLPQIMTLRPERRRYDLATTEEGLTVARATDIAQRNFWLRALYFVLIGWWFSLIWLELAWLIDALAFLLVLTIIGIPLAFPMFVLSFWMFALSGAVTTLRRS